MTAFAQVEFLDDASEGGVLVAVERELLQASFAGVYLFIRGERRYHGKHTDAKSLVKRSRRAHRQGTMATHVRILIVDDDQEICNLIGRYAEREGWEYDSAPDGKRALDLFNSNDYQLVVLDITMPERSGTEVCLHIRDNSHVPIVFLTARDSEADKVAGLDLGADDFITKPFSIHEVMARLRAHVRRYCGDGSRASSRVVAGAIEIDTDAHRVTVDSQEVELTAMEFDLLLHFATQPGRVFTKQQLLRQVWKQEYSTDENTVMVHIRRLRRKIEANPDDPQLIQTVWGIGYKLRA